MANPIPFPTSALWDGDLDDELGKKPKSHHHVVYRSAAHGNYSGSCPWDPWRAWLLALYPPLPSGNTNEVWLPNDAKPGIELSLTVASEEDKYPFNVPPGGYGGRQVRVLQKETLTLPKRCRVSLGYFDRKVSCQDAISLSLKYQNIGALSRNYNRFSAPLA